MIDSEAQKREKEAWGDESKGEIPALEVSEHEKKHSVALARAKRDEDEMRAFLAMTFLGEDGPIAAALVGMGVGSMADLSDKEIASPETLADLGLDEDAVARLYEALKERENPV